MDDSFSSLRFESDSNCTDTRSRPPPGLLMKRSWLELVWRKRGCGQRSSSQNVARWAATRVPITAGFVARSCNGPDRCSSHFETKLFASLLSSTATCVQYQPDGADIHGELDPWLSQAISISTTTGAASMTPSLRTVTTRSSTVAVLTRGKPDGHAIPTTLIVAVACEGSVPPVPDSATPLPSGTDQAGSRGRTTPRRPEVQCGCRDG